MDLRNIDGFHWADYLYAAQQSPVQTVTFTNFIGHSSDAGECCDGGGLLERGGTGTPPTRTL